MRQLIPSGARSEAYLKSGVGTSSLGISFSAEIRGFRLQLLRNSRLQDISRQCLLEGDDISSFSKIFFERDLRARSPNSQLGIHIEVTGCFDRELTDRLAGNGVVIGLPAGYSLFIDYDEPMLCGNEEIAHHFVYSSELFALNRDGNKLLCEFFRVDLRGSSENVVDQSRQSLLLQTLISSNSTPLPDTRKTSVGFLTLKVGCMASSEPRPSMVAFTVVPHVTTRRVYH